MELVEVSLKKLENLDKELYEKIKMSYDYDLVIFVARGAFQIGYDLANLKNVPLLEIFAKRKGNGLKKKLQPVLTLVPKKFRKILREKEIHSNVHANNSERAISFDKNLWNKYLDCKKILLVDDSVDTGNTIKYVKEAICLFFKNAEVKIAALNVFKKSRNLVSIDYFLFEEMLFCGPWSNDSKEYKTYSTMYEKWHANKQ